MNKLKSHLPERWKILAALLIVYDFLSVPLAYFLVLWARYDFVYSLIPDTMFHTCLRVTPVYALVCVLVYAGCRLYRSIWCFASYSELTRGIAAVAGLAVAHTVIVEAFIGGMPASYYMAGAMLQMFAVLAPRFGYRFLLYLRNLRALREGQAERARVMLIGAGSAGQMILRDIKVSDKVNAKVVCIIDDNPNKWNRDLEGVPIVGGRDDILANVAKYRVTQIFFAIPTASAATRRDILSICNETGCELKVLPGVYQFVEGQVSVSAMKDVSVEDLLGREPIRTDMDEVFSFIHGKTILVTGGGGSIGSELCRQIAAHNPKRLIIFDIYENNAYDIQLELRKQYPALDLVTLIGSVRDSRRVEQVFQTYRPDVVYHAAAHKHVPLMEDSPCESIKNNVVGTYKCCYAALRAGCSRFVLVSTDKAVNPTNIMGASKRLCEMVVQAFDALVRAGRADVLPELHTHAAPLPVGPEVGQTAFVAVRFGNVLGSNGSVVPLFKKQIAAGGPVTVTHPDIIRYFMTIPEAVSLILLAGTYAQGGEIFVLDMGSPVKIDTLARNLIKLCGYKPDEDIQIVYTGLRPGEKLYEETLMAEEGLEKTANNLIHIGKPIPFDNDAFVQQLRQLTQLAYDNDESAIRDFVRQMVSTYHPEKGGPDQ